MSFCLKDFHFCHVTEFFPRPKIHVMLDPLYIIFLYWVHSHRKVTNTSLSCLQAHARFFRLSMNGKFDFFFYGDLFGKSWFPYYKHALILATLWYNFWEWKFTEQEYHLGFLKKRFLFEWPGGIRPN